VSATRVVLGRVSAAYGIRGWVKVASFTDPPDALLDYSRWLLRRTDGTEVAYALQDAEFDGRNLRVALQGVQDRNGAELLRGCEIAVPRSELPSPAEREYYQQDLLGFEVRNLEGALLGVLDHFIDGAAQPMMAVRGAREVWIPAVPVHLKKVDLAARQVVVDWPADWP
jgi:16S rRNA processing protein RimM